MTCCLLAILLLTLIEHTSARFTLDQMCGLNKDHKCKTEVKDVPRQVSAICSACGDLWGNIPGFEYCCQCSHMIFGFCYNAVMGNGPPRRG